jgi:ubiquinone/menaquinone biosynthesis C-methylase UbiE
MKNKNRTNDWWNYVRSQELKPLFDFLPKEKNIKILEIGGGNGFQASKISEIGYSITSIDISPKNPSYFHVEKIDSCNLPYSDHSFDIVMTSVVLQHIEHLDEVFIEMNRVLKSDGIMIHLVPTSWWSIFTNFWHYCFIPKFLIKSIKKKISNKLNCQINSKQKIQKEKSNQTILKKLFLHPLEFNKSFIHDIFYFRKNSWKRILKKYSLEIIDIKNCPITSTGYGVFKNKLLQARKFFALHYFPTIICIVVKKL